MQKRWPLFLVSALLLYFIGHALFGENQSLPLAELKSERIALSQKKAALLTEKKALERKIYALRPETLDLDYVEEIARQRLYMLYPDEIMVVYDTQASKSDNQ